MISICGLQRQEAVLWLLTVFPSAMMNKELGEMIHLNTLAHRVRRVLESIAPICFTRWVSYRICRPNSLQLPQVGLLWRWRGDQTQCFKCTKQVFYLLLGYALVLQPRIYWHAWTQPALSPRTFLAISLFSYLSHSIMKQPPPEWFL